MTNQFQILQTARGKQLHYRLTLPNQFDSANEYPTILALPPGAQTHDLVLAYDHWLPGLHLPIHFLVGENDDNWRKKSEHFHGRITEMNGRSTLEIIPNQGHMAFHTISAARLIQIILTLPLT